MGVGIQRKGRLRVAQNSGQGLGIDSAGQGMGGEGMTQVMEPNVGQASGVQQGLQVTVCGAGIGGGFGLQRIWEDPLRIRMFFPFRQKLGGACRQEDISGPPPGLGGSGYQPATLFYVDGPLYCQCSGYFIEVRPHKPA